MLQSDNDLWANGVVLSFDLDTKKLKLFYSKTSYQGAYEIIKIFLKANGFEHLKDSDYVNSKLDYIETLEILTDFAMKNKWFPVCQNKVIISPNVQRLDLSVDIDNLVDKEWVNKCIIESQQPDISKDKPSLDEITPEDNNIPRRRR